MSAATDSGQEPRVEQPKYPLHAMTTFELCGYRGQLERAIAFLVAKNPAPRVRGDLHAALDDVIAEQEDRKGLADA